MFSNLLDMLKFIRHRRTKNAKLEDCRAWKTHLLLKLTLKRNSRIKDKINQDYQRLSKKRMIKRTLMKHKKQSIKKRFSKKSLK